MPTRHARTSGQATSSAGSPVCPNSHSSTWPRPAWVTARLPTRRSPWRTTVSLCPGARRLAWARRRAPGQSETVVLHGDLRVGNLAVTQAGLGHVLEWEFGHTGDPAEDVAWPLVRAWRVGIDQLRLGGVGEVEPYLERYNALTGRHITLASLDYWEIVG